MKPIEFEGQNVVFAKDQPEYIPLPAFRDEKGNITTVWEFTPEERALIARGENLNINVMTFNQALQPLRPYIEDTGKQLVEKCACINRTVTEGICNGCNKPI